MSGIVSKIKDHKYVTSLSLMAGLMVLMSITSFAAEDTETVTSITSAFGDIKATALAALAAVAGIAILLFGAIYAWKYGKKVFSVISK